MLIFVSLNESEKWDEIVKSFYNYDVYYLSGYVKCLNEYGDGNPLLIYYEKEGFRIINVVMKRDIAKLRVFHDILEDNSRFDLVTPYGYGGFLIDGEPNDKEMSDFFDEYKRVLKRNQIVSEFIRFHPNNSIDRLKKFISIEDIGKTITIELSNNENIWNDFTSKNRNMIRKSMKSGVEIYCCNDKAFIKTFKDIYDETMNRQNASSFYFFNDSYYECLVRELKNNFQFFYAVRNKEVIAASIILLSNKNMHYHLSGMRSSAKPYAPMNLLLFEISKWGLENGFTSFHLGGGLGGRSDTSLFKFKSSFNKRSHNIYSIGKIISDIEMYNYLVNQHCSEEARANGFFPVYRTN